MTARHLDADDILNLRERTGQPLMPWQLQHLAAACMACRQTLEEAGLLDGPAGAYGSHLEPADLFSAFRASADPLLLHILLHSTACCAHCGQQARAIGRLWATGELGQQGDLTEADVLLALSREKAPALGRELATLPQAQARSAIEVQERFASWGLAEWLCNASHAAAREDADRALGLADLALAVAAKAPLPDLTEDCRLELLMLAYAHRGNALRVAEELRSAAVEFERAEDCWRRAEARWFPYRAEVLSLRMSLERYQRQYEDCLETGAEAQAVLAHEARPCRALGIQILVKKAIALRELGRPVEALVATRKAAENVDPSREPALWSSTMQTQLALLTELDCFDESEALLPIVTEHLRKHGSKPDLLRADWVKASLFGATGRGSEAVEILRTVRRGFLEMNLRFTAAIASLELATLYFTQGQLHRVRSLALEMLPVFQEKGIHREALAALAIFQQAAITETVTEGLLTDLVAYFRKAQSNPTLAFRCASSAR